MNAESFGRLTDAAANLVVVGARVIDPASGTDAVRDVAVADGRIVESSSPGAERIDGAGMVVAPGLCDLHAHLREPGSGGAESIVSGSRAAARGGYTTVCAMPNTEPPLDSADAVAAVMAVAVDASCVVRVIGAATRGRAGTEPVDLESLAEAGAVGFSDDGAAVADREVARAVFASLARLRRPLIEHAEDAALAEGGVMRAGPAATRLGLRPWPPEAEAAIVERDIALAAEAGAPLHLTHLSTAAAVTAVREAKGRGEAVTCDVTPHHLVMTDAWVAGSRRFAWNEPETKAELAYDGACRVNPPLPSRDDALALLAAVADGTVDAIATDHAPHPSERKLVPFDDAAPGLIGLETALSLGLAAADAGRITLPKLVAAMSTRPAAIIGEAPSLAVGAAANLVLFDPTATWVVEASALASASANTPLLGMELPGVVRLTMAGGRVTYRS
ncbi:MAG: dihydroorotase [Candidatus Limnocylindria bacterium]